MQHRLGQGQHQENERQRHKQQTEPVAQFLQQRGRPALLKDSFPEKPGARPAAERMHLDQVDQRQRHQRQQGP